MQFMNFVGQFPHPFDWSSDLYSSRSFLPTLWRCVELILSEI